MPASIEIRADEYGKRHQRVAVIRCYSPTTTEALASTFVVAAAPAAAAVASAVAASVVPRRLAASVMISLVDVFITLNSLSIGPVWGRWNYSLCTA